MELRDKVILITGATGGIGAATAHRLAAEGMALALTGRNADRLDTVATKCRAEGSKVEVFPGDLTDPEFLEGLPDAVAARFGSLHALFNNAGIFEMAPVQDADLTRWDTALDVNFRSLVHLTKLSLPHLPRPSRKCGDQSQFGGRAHDLCKRWHLQRHQTRAACLHRVPVRKISGIAA